MKRLKVLFLAALMIFAVQMNAKADETMVEAYAHPSLFGSQTYEYSTDNGTYVTGGNIAKSKDGFAINGKENVLVKSWANDVLGLIRDQYKDSALFDTKMPILRSELAVVLAEGFALPKADKITKKYGDISNNYWAKDWIYRALEANVMIGYPCGNFMPDQPVTKAEVFATIAQIIDAPVDADAEALSFKGKRVQFIPTWAENATKEVLGSKLLEEVPNPNKVIEDEFLSKEQVAYLVGALRSDLAYYQRLALDPNAPSAIKKYAPTVLTVKLNDRISAKHSNINDSFSAKTTKDVCISGTCFPAGSKVYGKVVDVKRPGLNGDEEGLFSNGYVRVKFEKIKNGDAVAEFPKTLSDAKADTLKNPNFIARLLGMPLSGSGRVLGVVGRTGGTAADVCGNGLEAIGDDLSGFLVETTCLKPLEGIKSFGWGFVDLGKGIYDLGKLAVSGVFGVVYEVADELVYLILPSASNNASLNPNEELVIIF